MSLPSYLMVMVTVMMTVIVLVSQGSPTFLHRPVSVNDLSRVSSQVPQACRASLPCQLPVWVGEHMQSLASVYVCPNFYFPLDHLMFPLPTYTDSKSATDTWIAFSLSCVCG